MRDGMNARHKKSRTRRFLATSAPIIGLLLLVAVYVLVGINRDIRFDKGFKTILNSAAICAVVGTGAVFIYTLGSFDISLGASTCVSALCGAMAYNATGSILVMLVTCIVVAVGISLLSSVLASAFNLPVFITTVAMMSVLGAVALLLIGANGTGDNIKVPAKAVRAYDTVELRLAILAGYVILCMFIYQFTPLGRQMKFSGSNPLCATLTGIRINRLAIAAFALCGLGVGLGAFLSITYAPTLTRNTAGDIGMNVIMAIVFGGMPVSGGARSRIYAAVVGAFSMAVLGQIMTTLQLGSGWGQFVKAACFLGVVVVTSMGYRGKLLAR